MIQVLTYRNTYSNNKISLFYNALRPLSAFIYIISFVDNTLMHVYTYVCMYVCMIYASLYTVPLLSCDLDILSDLHQLTVLISGRSSSWILFFWLKPNESYWIDHAGYAGLCYVPVTETIMWMVNPRIEQCTTASAVRDPVSTPSNARRLPLSDWRKRHVPNQA